MPQPHDYNAPVLHHKILVNAIQSLEGALAETLGDKKSFKDPDSLAAIIRTCTGLQNIVDRLTDAIDKAAKDGKEVTHPCCSLCLDQPLRQLRILQVAAAKKDKDDKDKTDKTPEVPSAPST